MKNLILGSVMALIPTHAMAGEWIHVASNNNMDLGVDVETIRTDGNRRQFWSVVAQKESQTIPQGSYDYAVARMEVDCFNETSRPIQLTLYRLGEDEVVLSQTSTEGSRYQAPDTIGYHQLVFVCGDEWSSDTALPSAAIFASVMRATDAAMQTMEDERY